MVEVAVGPVEHVTAQGFAHRTRVGIMPIGRHSFWSVAYHIGGLLEKALGRLPISRLTHHRVNQVAITIDGPREVAPVPFDVDRGFIHGPGPRLFDLVAWHVTALPGVVQSAFPSLERPHG